MTSTHITRFVKAVVAAAVVVLALPLVASAAGSRFGAPDGWITYVRSLSTPGQVLDGRSPDTIDAGRAAHGLAVTGSSSRYGAPDGWITYVRSLSAPSGQRVDGRSPDTIDAALAAHGSTAGPILDGRAPDTVDAAQAAHAPQSIQLVHGNGFDWSTAGIGVGGGAVLIGLLGTGLLLVRRHGVQTT